MWMDDLALEDMEKKRCMHEIHTAGKTEWEDGEKDRGRSKKGRESITKLILARLAHFPPLVLHDFTRSYWFPAEAHQGTATIKT